MTLTVKKHLWPSAVHGSDVDPTSRLILQSTSRSVTSLLPRLERLEAGDPRNDVEDVENGLFLKVSSTTCHSEYSTMRYL